MVVIAMCDIFPQILEPGVLESLNREAIDSLGTPLFFSSPDLKRPHTSESRGRFYEVVTGIYVAYHDYGARFLITFLRFCRQKNIPAYCSFMIKHYYIICSLRGALCHGGLENGAHFSRLCMNLRRYLPEQDGEDLLAQFNALSEMECTTALQKLCADADRFLNQLHLCIKAVGNERIQRADWKQYLIQNALNSKEPVYGRFYFDQRIVNDLEQAVKARNSQKDYGETVCSWLSDLKKVIETDSIPDTDYLRRTLFEALYRLYHPQEFPAEKSSVDLLIDF